jgi:hypothetical protein
MTPSGMISKHMQLSIPYSCAVTGVDIIPFDRTYLQATSVLFKKGYQCGGDSGARRINQFGCFCCVSFQTFPWRPEGSPGHDDGTNGRSKRSRDKTWPDRELVLTQEVLMTEDNIPFDEAAAGQFIIISSIF